MNEVIYEGPLRPRQVLCLPAPVGGHMLLMRVESIRIRRVAVHHGVGLVAITFKEGRKHRSETGTV